MWTALLSYFNVPAQCLGYVLYHNFTTNIDVISWRCSLGGITWRVASFNVLVVQEYSCSLHYFTVILLFIVLLLALCVPSKVSVSITRSVIVLYAKCFMHIEVILSHCWLCMFYCIVHRCMHTCVFTCNGSYPNHTSALTILFCECCTLISSPRHVHDVLAFGRMVSWAYKESSRHK